MTLRERIRTRNAEGEDRRRGDAWRRLADDDSRRYGRRGDIMKHRRRTVVVLIEIDSRLTVHNS